MADREEKAGSRHRISLLATITGILALAVAVTGVGIQAYQAKVWPFASTTTTSNGTPCNGFSDTFQGPALDPRWAPISLFPNTQATYLLTTGSLLPSGVDLFASYNFDAPRIMQSTHGNFTVETTVSLTSVPNIGDRYQGAGILVWQDQNTFVRLENGYRNNQHDIEFAEYQNGQFNPLKSEVTSGAQVTLTLQRSGNTLTASWTSGDGTSHALGTANVQFVPTEVGLVLINSSGNPPDVTDSATFSGFSLSCL